MGLPCPTRSAVRPSPQSTQSTGDWQHTDRRRSQTCPPPMGPWATVTTARKTCIHIICSLFTFSQRAMWACLGFYVYVVASKAALALALAFDFAISQRHRAAWTLPRVPHQVLQAAFSTPAGLSAQARRIPEGRLLALTFVPSFSDVPRAWPVHCALRTVQGTSVCMRAHTHRCDTRKSVC